MRYIISCLGPWTHDGLGGGGDDSPHGLFTDVDHEETATRLDSLFIVSLFESLFPTRRKGRAMTPQMTMSRGRWEMIVDAIEGGRGVGVMMMMMMVVVVVVVMMVVMMVMMLGLDDGR